ncbi:hypothetical protein NQ318_002474 [Aromia moschata]|uniref:Uncharacterized protein n=1 Tax=Aromia moschata TaxID=1265417 RepID=A0AAV8Y9J4_9CUCU|nr:hypothetical protein NQ318_002474 [Aromia moschata]
MDMEILVIPFGVEQVVKVALSQINTEETRNVAQDTFKKILNELTKANNSLKEVTDLRNEMRDFLGQNNTKPGRY